MRGSLWILLSAVLSAPLPATKGVFRLQLPKGGGMGPCATCSISVTPTVVKTGDWIQVTLQNISYPDYSDWVGVFAPEDITDQGVFTKYPVRYQMATTSCVPATTPPPPNTTCIGAACCQRNSYQKTGTATLGFMLVNLRMNYVFALIRGPAPFPTLLALSPVVSFANLDEPLQVHLALTKDPSEMRVTWVSSGVRAEAMWGVDSSSLNNTVLADSNTYESSQLCGNPAQFLGFRDPGIIHTAVLKSLAPQTKYYYKVGNDEGGWFSSSFISAPPASTHVIFDAFGDMGKATSAWDGSLEFSWDNENKGEPGAHNTSTQLTAELNNGVSMILHIGDLSYAVGFAPEWEEFLAQIEPVASRVPWMTSPGNHETNCPCFQGFNPNFVWLNGSDSGGECGVPYAYRFPMPSGPLGDPWYSFEYGDVSIIMMSTEHDFSAGTKQLAWIEQALQAVDRTRTPFVIFTGHRPMYLSSLYSAPETTYLLKYIQPLLLRYQVDLVLWGHHHSYQRMCPLTVNGTCQTPAMEPAVVHAIIGVAGYEFSALGAVPPAWVKFSENKTFGFARISTNATHLHFAFLSSSDGSLIDAVDIAKRS